ncbi:MAG: Na+/H+ antiporter subunit E [Actinomycetota bacterium]|nr:Na+/H+ antiporter subunit E [Actinomycetota bacterium]
MRRLAELVVMVAVWMGLWRELTLANLLSGVLVALAVLVAFRRQAPPWRLRPLLRPLAALRLLGHFMFKLVEATLVVAWEVVTPTLRVTEGIVAVPTLSSSDVVTTLVANAVSLMPGTVAVEVADDPRVLYVHVLHLRGPESVRREVRRLEELVIEAVGSPEAREREDVTEPSTPAEEKP